MNHHEIQQVSARAIHKLTAAEGYLELNMPDHALEELAEIGDAGPFAPAVDLMTGEALRVQKRYEDAIAPLRRAAESIPAPHNRRAWLALSECLREDGQDILADAAAVRGRPLKRARQIIHGVVHINIAIEPFPDDDSDSS